MSWGRSLITHVPGSITKRLQTVKLIGIRVPDHLSPHSLLVTVIPSTLRSTARDQVVPADRVRRRANRKFPLGWSVQGEPEISCTPRTGPTADTTLLPINAVFLFDQPTAGYFPRAADEKTLILFLILLPTSEDQDQDAQYSTSEGHRCVSYRFVDPRRVSQRSCRSFIERPGTSELHTSLTQSHTGRSTRRRDRKLNEM